MRAWRDVVASYDFTSLLELISLLKKESISLLKKGPISFLNSYVGSALQFHLTTQLFLSLGITCIERIASIFLKRSAQYMAQLTQPQGKDEAASQSRFIRLLSNQKTLLYKWQTSIQCIRMITVPNLLQFDVADVELLLVGIRGKTVTPLPPTLMEIWEYMGGDAILSTYVSWLDQYRERRVASCAWNRREIQWENQTMKLKLEFGSNADVAVTHQGVMCDYCACSRRR